jgi:hypothetical protein
MSNIQLPQSGEFDTNGNCLQITQNGPTGGSGGIAIRAESYGVDTQDGTAGCGLLGQSDVGQGVQAVSSSGNALQAQSDNGLSVLAGVDSVFGQHAGVYGQSDQQGVFGHATNDVGTGVFGNSVGGGFGVRGESVDGTAVQGTSFGNGRAVHGISDHGIAGQFDGEVVVPVGNVDILTGNLSVEIGHINVHNGNINLKNNASIFLDQGDVKLTGADCAEDFDMSAGENVEPGSVMVIGMGGGLEQSQKAYDKKVVGIVSGGGEYRPGIVLDKRQTKGLRATVAMLGKVYCKVDAQYSPIEVGDLLTTSPTQGHAMKADNAPQAFGAVIGKALATLKEGRGMIPVLVALQ